MPSFTHIDKKGNVRMVDVTEKKLTERKAVATGTVSMNPSTFRMVKNKKVKKGNVIETARIAGIMAAKKTPDLIPMCHPLNLSHVAVDFYPEESSSSIRIESSVKVFGQTGVEMEALTAVAVAALTIYDMCKSYDREMTITDIFLVEKEGGKSGKFVRKK
jgi:cyclic pyranopterin monophosphate synthase